MSEQEYRRRLQEARNRAVRLYDRLISYSGFEAEIIREGLLDLIQEAIPELRAVLDSKSRKVSEYNSIYPDL